MTKSGEEVFQLNKQEIKSLIKQHPQAFVDFTRHKVALIVRYLKIQLQFDQKELKEGFIEKHFHTFISFTHKTLSYTISYLETFLSIEEIKQLIIQHPEAFVDLNIDRFAVTIDILEKQLQMNTDEVKKVIKQNLLALTKTHPNLLKKVLSFMKDHLDTEEIKTRLLEDSQAIPTYKLQVLKQVMPFIDSYIGLSTHLSEDNSLTPIHWLLFTKNPEQILPIAQKYKHSKHILNDFDEEQVISFFKGEVDPPSTDSKCAEAFY